MKKLNILYATPSRGRSGGIRQLLMNIEAVNCLGHNTFIACPDKALLLHELDSNTHIFSLPNSQYHFITKFTKIIHDYNIDIVHCFHGKLYKLFLLIKIFKPSFKLFLNRGVIFRPGSFPLLWLPQLNGIICNSHASANVLQKYFVPKKKIYIVYNAVNITKQTKHKNDKFTITFIGNKRPYKGFDIFLKSISELFRKIDPSKLRINVVGIAPNTIFYNIVDALTLSRINFLGGMDHTKVLDILSTTDVLTITSRQESMPNVLLEAYAMGVPVVATKVGGIPEVLKHGQNGFLCPTEDINLIAKMIIKLYSNPTLKVKIGEHNMQTAKENFSIKQKGKKLIAIYEKALAVSVCNN